MNQISKSILISNGIYSEKDLIKLIKFNRYLLTTRFRNDDDTMSAMFRVDLLKRTRILLEEAVKNGIKDPEISKTARLLGFNDIAY